jgi:predicted esterase
VTHGAGGRPEPHCEFYASFVKDRAFILCTRGRAMERHLPEPERGYFYDGHHELGKEVLAAIDAAEARWGIRLDHERAIFAGYSQGASMGLLFLHGKREHAARFGRAIFVEGGSADWNVALSRQMNEAGLTRVAIVCGQTSCKKTADQSVRYMAQGGLERSLRYAPGAGHTYGGPVATHVETAFAWLVEGDPRFSPTER